jgi:hypothetical protein
MLKGYSTMSSRKENGPKEGIKIYPNPFDDFLLIEGAEEIEKVVLWTVMGRKVIQFAGRGEGQVMINLSGLPAGIYIVELILKDNNREFVKVVKER